MELKYDSDFTMEGLRGFDIRRGLGENPITGAASGQGINQSIKK